MKTTCTVIAVALTGMATALWAADESPAQKKRTNENQAEAKATTVDKMAGLQDQLQRVSAALAVAEKSDTPNARRIANLTRRQAQLQAQLKEAGAEPEQSEQIEQADVQGGGGVCPFGCTPLGPGPRAGRGGCGQGTCPGNGAGGGGGPWGPGAGMGQGPPPWAGSGQGRGMGYGHGNGRGAGGGWGRGGGRGMGGGGPKAGL